MMSWSAVAVSFGPPASATDTVGCTASTAPSASAKPMTTWAIVKLVRLAGKSEGVTSIVITIGVGVVAGLFSAYHWSGKLYCRLNALSAEKSVPSAALTMVA